jgi:hypothetical protein
VAAVGPANQSSSYLAGSGQEAVAPPGNCGGLKSLYVSNRFIPTMDLLSERLILSRSPITEFGRTRDECSGSDLDSDQDFMTG